MEHTLQGRRIIVGVTGGIAAYKAIELVSRLRKQGAEVKVVMTKNATHIASPLTFGEISGHPVALDMWEQVHDWNVEHITLATWAEAYIVAPTTANCLGKIAHGIADDMLTTTIMATKAKIYLCPAMNTDMYINPITQENIAKLKSLGYAIMDSASGILACGTSGLGRLPEPIDILHWFMEDFCKNDLLKDKKVLITAGGTQEAIDPVRYIGNHSSGKMGYAVAQAAQLAGAKTILISSPTNLSVPYGVTYISVTSAREMEHEVNRLFDDMDAVIMSAAVSDFRVANVEKNKIKKKDSLLLELVKNPDILKGLGERKKGQVLIGFAAETEDVISYGKDKLLKKNLDMIVANDVSKKDIGFNTDMNEVTFIYKNGNTEDISKMSKQNVANLIIKRLAKLLNNE